MATHRDLVMLFVRPSAFSACFWFVWVAVTLVCYLYVWHNVNVNSDLPVNVQSPSYLPVDGRARRRKDSPVDGDENVERRRPWRVRHDPTASEPVTEDTSEHQRAAGYCSSLQSSSHVHSQEGVVEPGYRLAAVIVITRHGDRSPMYTLPNHSGLKLSCRLNTSTDRSLKSFMSAMNTVLQNMSANSIFHRYGLYPNSATCYGAQLTSAGTMQMIQLGQFLRMKYPSLAREARSSRLKAYVRSTEYPRTFQSAVAFLYGFGVGPDLVSNATIEVTRNIFFCSENQSNLTCNCPAASKMLASAKKQRKYSSEERHVRSEIARVFNVTSSRLPWMTAMLEVFMAHLCHNLSLPCGPDECITPDMVERMWQIALKSHLQEQSDETVARGSELLAQPFLTEIVQRLIDASFYRTRKQAPRLVVYSGHDKTLLLIIRALKLHDASWPSFASRLVFELHSSHSRQRARYFIRVLFNGRNLTTQLEFCPKSSLVDGLCPLDNFIYATFTQRTDESVKLPYSKACGKIV